MRAFVTVLAILLLIYTTYAQDNGVSTTKKCEDILAQNICQNFRRIATALHEKISVVNDAINAAVTKHLNRTTEIVKFVNEYLAANLNCTKVLSEQLCTQLKTLGSNAKLTILQIKEAIEQAVAKGASSVKEIYAKAVEVMKSLVNCSVFLGDTACNNLKLAAQMFGEQYQLVKDAIFAAAQKHISNLNDLFNSVASKLIAAAKDFKCETVLSTDICRNIQSLAKTLHLTTQQVREAIEKAIINGAQGVKDIYNRTITILTTEINCEKILSKLTCDNLQNAIIKLHEQRKLIQEAIMSAALHHLNKTQEILKFVKQKIVTAVKNFKCTDILTQKQCDFIVYVAKRFHLRTTELTQTIIETIVNGTSSAKQIYDKTLGALVEEAKNLKCEQLIDDNTCGILKTLAQNLNVKAAQVTLAIREAIVNGLEKTGEIVAFVRNFVIEKLSCNNFLSEKICDKIEELAVRLHVSFQAVINKLREWFANGVSIATMPLKIVKWIWQQFWGQVYDMVAKRSLEIDEKRRAKIIQSAILEKLLSDMQKLINRLKTLIKQGKMSKRDAYLETGSLTPGELTPGGLETGSLTPGGLTPGGLETGSLIPGGLIPGGLETGSLERGGLETGTLETGGLETGSLQDEETKLTKSEKIQKIFEGFLSKLKDQLKKLKSSLSKVIHDKDLIENQLAVTYELMKESIMRQIPSLK